MTISGPITGNKNLHSREPFSAPGRDKDEATGPVPREILFFAITSDLAKARSLTLTLDDNLTFGQFRAYLVSILPDLATQLPLCALAGDGAIAMDSDKLGPAQTIAILPPVSGG